MADEGGEATSAGDRGAEVHLGRCGRRTGRGQHVLPASGGRYARMGRGAGLSEQPVAQRAALRAIDKNEPQALSGYRPRLSVTASRRL